MDNVNDKLNTIVKEELEIFLKEYIRSPYLCYTEHGVHALFFQRLYSKLPESLRNIELYIAGEKIMVCRIQKEYPTKTDLGRSRRQNWDLAVIGDTGKEQDKYDELPLCCVVEFGLNATFEHLKDDVERVGHDGACVDNTYVVHLYRISEAGKKISRRDASRNHKEIIDWEKSDKTLSAIKV